MKKHLSLILILCLMVSCFGTFTTFADSTEDRAFDEAYKLLSAINAVEGGEGFNKNDKITRGEIAEAVSSIMGLSSISTVVSKKDDNVYLGYTNEDTFEQEWQWIVDAPSTEEAETVVDPMENATPFYDVTTLHKNWDAINKVASLGIMNGSGDGYFRPDDYATVNEIAAVCVKMLGAEMLTDKNYPIGYTMVAGSEGIIDGISATDYASLISKRDFYIMLCNTVTSQYYKVFGYGDMYTVHKTNTMLLSATQDIYKTSGVVTANERTYLDSNEKLGKDKIMIDGVIYDCPDYDTNSILGHNVNVYYKKTQLMEVPEIVLITDTKTTTLTIPAEKIASFKDYKYTYADENDKTEVEKISADIDVIYNDEALTSFTSNDLKPNNGTVTLIDNDEDGQWDVLNIENFRIMFVNSVDSFKEIIYGSNADFKELNLQNTKYDVYDKDGNAVLLANIRNRDIISVKGNLSAQGADYYLIEIVTTVVKGTLESIAFDEIYTIDGIEYEISKDCMTTIELGDYGTFYLDNNGRIYNFEKEIKSNLQYGYVVTADVDSMGDEYRVRLFLMDGTFENFTLNKKITLNRSIVNKSVAYSSFVDDYGTAKNQLILFYANEDKVITEVQTSDIFEDGLQKKAGVGGSYGYRRNGSFLLNNATVSFWATEATPYITVPSPAECMDEEKYLINPAPQNDMTYSITEAYVTHKDSIVTDVLVTVLPANSGSSETEDRDFGYHGNQVPAMVQKISQVINDNGDICYSIKTINYNGEQSYTTNDNKLDAVIADLEKGDIIQVKTSSGYLSKIRKVYDVGTHKMRDKAALDTAETYGAQGVGNDFLRANTLIQGYAGKPAYNDGYFMFNWALYEENELVGPSDTELSVKASEMTFIVFDTSKNDEPYMGSANDVVFEHDGITGDELIVHHAWAAGRTVYIIK